MAPLKFEDSIKEKLEQRTIQPSDESWDKLDQQLNDQHSSRKVKNYWWLGIAASIIGFLILSTVFITSNEKVESNNRELVDVNKEGVKENRSTDFVKIKPQELKQEIREIESNKESLIKPTVIVKNHDFESNSLKKREDKEDINVDFNSINSINEGVFKNNTTETVAIQIDTIISKKRVIEEDKSPPFTVEIIETKIAGVVEKVKELEKNNGVVTDEEVDALLRKAQLEITTEQILKSNTVSASALLLDVESELDESFKDRVFEALKTGFEKLKTTVAERDN
ncbi:hypothetical protein [Aquimarina rubra]|uniref:Anti-sigma factor n=1 Tax=Aquimarina rubra TaxID=1920033 RepID=A0ABW5LHF2_9FLAO